MLSCYDTWSTPYHRVNHHITYNTRSLCDHHVVIHINHFLIPWLIHSECHVHAQTLCTSGLALYTTVTHTLSIRSTGRVATVRTTRFHLCIHRNPYCLSQIPLPSYDHTDIYTNFPWRCTISNCSPVYSPFVRFWCTPTLPPPVSTSFIYFYTPDHSITECVRTNTMYTLRQLPSLLHVLHLDHIYAHAHIVYVHNILHTHRINHNLPNSLSTILYRLPRFYRHLHIVSRL